MKTVFNIYLISGGVVKYGIPDDRKCNTDSKEDKTGDKNTMLALTLFPAKLTLAVISISLLILSAHRDKEIYNAL